MGQAKLRGTFEQRKAHAIERKQAEVIARQKELEDWWASLTDEQKAEEINRRRCERDVVNSVYDILNVLRPYTQISKTFKLV
jgi:uncharacterized protein (DUF927 family)